MKLSITNIITLILLSLLLTSIILLMGGSMALVYTANFVLGVVSGKYIPAIQPKEEEWVQVEENR